MNNWNEIEQTCDKYFTRARKVANKFGTVEVTYAFFVRRPVMVAIDPAIAFIKEWCPEAVINRTFVDKSGNEVVNKEGNLVPTAKKIFEVTGPYTQLSELETRILQKVGFSCVAAYNAYHIAKTLPEIPFIDMSARHTTGPEMHEAAAYGAFVGSKRAREEGAKGFTGTSTDATSKIFGVPYGVGTIPHALVGYAEHTIQCGEMPQMSDNGTLRSVQMFIEANPEVQNVVALVDFYGQEVTDSLVTSEWFYKQNLDNQGKNLAVRLDTHGGRFVEGLDYKSSVEVLEEHTNIGGEFEIVKHVMGSTAYALDPDDLIVDKVRKILFGAGVSAANIVYMRNNLDKAGYSKTGIIASSGFNIQKCTIMDAIKAPISAVGTGSFLPSKLSETFATADVIKYGNNYSVKVGREYLYQENQRRKDVA